MGRFIFTCLFSIFAFIFFFGQIAFASTLEEARAKLITGEYDAAIDMALALDTPKGLMLAAETLSAKVMLGYVDDANSEAKRARKWAEDALEAMPTSKEAHIQYALAYGFETRTSSPFRAWRKKLPKKTLAAIEDCRTKYPEDPRGDALLGAWHLGIVRKAGAKNGEKWFEASEDLGIKWYESARKAAPNDIVIASNFAVTLLGLDAEKHITRSSEIMAAIANMPTKTAVDEDIKMRVAKLKATTNDMDALNAAVTEMLDGGVDKN